MGPARFFFLAGGVEESGVKEVGDAEVSEAEEVGAGEAEEVGDAELREAELSEVVDEKKVCEGLDSAATVTVKA
jgi:hypothetical protein